MPEKRAVKNSLKNPRFKVKCDPRMLFYPDKVKTKKNWLKIRILGCKNQAHEAMLLSCDFVFEEITNESIENFTKEKIELLMNYTQNGGAVTLKALRGLMQTEPDTLADSLDYSRDAPVYETQVLVIKIFC